MRSSVNVRVLLSTLELVCYPQRSRQPCFAHQTYMSLQCTLVWFTLACYWLRGSCIRLASPSTNFLPASFVQRIFVSQLRDDGHSKFNHTCALSRLELKTTHEGKSFARLVTLSCLKVILLDSIKIRMLVARLHLLDRIFCSPAFTNLALFG
jgi:hypothetical protein